MFSNLILAYSNVYELQMNEIHDLNQITTIDVCEIVKQLDKHGKFLYKRL